MSILRQKLIDELQLRGRAALTQAHYVRAIYNLARYYRRPPDQISEPELKAYLLYLLRERRHVRRDLLGGMDQRELILDDYVGGILSGFLDEFCAENLHVEQWNIKGLEAKLVDQFGLSMTATGRSPAIAGLKR